jgi:translation elongation factor EF-1alpha
MANIVVFGKAHSGKSTLIGYILSLQGICKVDEQKLVNEIGQGYDPSMYYAYQVDDSKNERNQPTRKSGNRRSGTHQSHIRNVILPNNQKVTMIDTPGAEHLKKEKERGAFYGDIGIFCLELNDVLSDDFFIYLEDKSTIRSSLTLWSYFKHKKIIVALTKSDLADYSEESYKKAKQKIHDLCNKSALESIFIIPIAIIVEERIGHNIDKKSEKLSWYSSLSLCEAIYAEDQKLELKNPNNALLFCIDREVEHPQSYAGKIWLIKIIQGKLRIDETITLSPVETENKELVSIKTKIKTIREDVHKSEGKSEVFSASQGSIVGIDLYDIHFGSKRMKKDAFHTINTSCGFCDGVDFDISDKLTISIASKDCQDFTENRQFSLLWFGRGVSFSVKKVISKDDNYLVISVELISGKIALPKTPDEEYYFTSLLIRDENKKLFYEATLLSVN